MTDHDPNAHEARIFNIFCPQFGFRIPVSSFFAEFLTYLCVLISLYASALSIVVCDRCSFCVLAKDRHAISRLIT